MFDRNPLAMVKGTTNKVMVNAALFVMDKDRLQRNYIYTYNYIYDPVYFRVKGYAAMAIDKYELRRDSNMDCLHISMRAQLQADAMDHETVKALLQIKRGNGLLRRASEQGKAKAFAKSVKPPAMAARQFMDPMSMRRSVAGGFKR